MGRLLRAAEISARALGLSFIPRKCATLHLAEKRQPIPTPFQLVGEHLPAGVGIDQTSYSAIDQLIADVGAISASLLAPWQKIETVATFLLPCLDLLFGGGEVNKTLLNEADRILQRTVKGWLKPLQRASAEVVFIPSSLGWMRAPFAGRSRGSYNRGPRVQDSERR